MHPHVMPARGWTCCPGDAQNNAAATQQTEHRTDVLCVGDHDHRCADRARYSPADVLCARSVGVPEIQIGMYEGAGFVKRCGLFPWWRAGVGARQGASRRLSTLGF